MNRSEPIIAGDLLLHLLEQTQPMTLHALAVRMQWPAQRVAGELDRLRQAGCTFDEHPQYGIRLIQSGINAWTDVLEQYAWTHGRVEIHRTTASTQDIARSRVQAHGRDACDTLIVADHQTAGRGRFGRRWTAPQGKTLTFSMVPSRAMSVDRLNLAASVALAGALDNLLQNTSHQTSIKWPNDIYINTRKIAGILIETATLPIIGIGINTHVDHDDWPTELRDKAVSLLQLGMAVDRLTVLISVLKSLRECMAMLEQPHQVNRHPLIEQWRQRCTLLHQTARLRSNGRDVEGEVLDVDPDAGLIVRLHAGQIIHLPAATTTVL